MGSPEEPKRLLGKVTEQERDHLRRLFERRNGLLELFRELPDLERSETAFLYDKIVSDLGRVVTSYEEWWAAMSAKYGWENTRGKRWEIDFETCDMFLRDGNGTSDSLPGAVENPAPAGTIKG